MKAVVIEETGGGRQVRLADIPQPQAGKGEVLVRVRAAAMNRADLMMNAAHREGTSAGAHAVAGMEFAGEVVEVGAGVQGFAPGDRVMAFGQAAFAEYTVVDYRLLIRIPGQIAWKDAAALPVALETMHDALITHGHLASGNTVLIQGAASGVGLIGMQIARVCGAGRILGAGRSLERLSGLEKYGMDVAIDTSQADWPKAVQAAAPEGAHVIVDMVSGPMVKGELEAAAIGGRVVNVGRLGGRGAEFDFDTHARKRITYTGVTFRTRSTEEIQVLIGAMLRDLTSALAAGKIAMPISSVHALDEAPAVYAAMKANTHLGKLVYQIPG